jgi:hypothetical protein
MYNAYLRM